MAISILISKKPDHYWVYIYIWSLDWNFRNLNIFSILIQVASQHLIKLVSKQCTYWTQHNLLEGTKSKRHSIIIIRTCTIFHSTRKNIQVAQIKEQSWNKAPRPSEIASHWQMNLRILLFDQEVKIFELMHLIMGVHVHLLIAVQRSTRQRGHEDSIQGIRRGPWDGGSMEPG